jgi:small conductance mechanosensitive channel
MELTPEQLQPYIEQLIPLVAVYGMNLLGAVVMLVAGWIAAKWLSGRTLNLLKKIPKFDLMLATFLSSLVRYAVVIFTMLAVLNQFGVQTASIIAVLGAASLAIGLAMQGTLRHIASGVMLLIFRPFKIGDFVEVGGTMGTIVNIGLFLTELRAPDGLHIVMPNSELWDKPIKNFTHNKTRRVDIIFGIAYEDDIGKALKMAEEVVNKDPRTLTEPAVPFINVSELGDSSVNILVRAWCPSSEFFAYKGDITRALKEGCDKKGITIPFPQRTLHMATPVTVAAPSGKKKAS